MFRKRDKSMVRLTPARQLEAKFESLLEAAPDAMVGVDRGGVIRFVNRQSERLFGYDRGDLVGQPIETLVPESFRAVHPTHRNGYFADPGTRAMGAGLELTGRRRDGSEFPVDISLSSLETEDGLLVTAAVRDITDRKRMEGLLDLARQDVDRFFSLSLDLLCIASTDGYFKRVNPAWQAVLGYENDELLGQPFTDFIHPDDLGPTAAEVVKLMDGEPSIAFENRYRCKDGSYRWLLWKVAPLPDQGLMYAVARDNTERRQVEQASARLAAIVDSSVDAIVGAGLDGIITSWNRGAEQIFGYRPDEIVGHPIGILAPMGDGQEDMLVRASRGDSIPLYEASRVRRDGRLIDVAVTTSPVRDPHGTVMGISMIARDISESRRAAAALRAIIATASDGFVSVDSSGVITEWNHRAEALFSWTRDEAVGHELAALIIPASQRDAHRTGLRRVLGRTGGESRVLDQLLEVSALHRDGHQIPVELAVWRVSAGPVEQFSAFVRDISARQQIARDVVAARDQAVEASRLKSQFLATMSHEIWTPMNGVVGLTSLLLRGDLDDEQRRYAEGIRVAGNTLLAVISDILDFSKIEAGAMILEEAAVNLGALLEEVVELVVQSAHGKSLELLSYCDPDLPLLLRGDLVRIRQILLNLATNAVKFTDRGEVVLRVLPEPDSGRAAKPASGPETVQVRFEVVDTGIGIAPADTARLFDAFAQADASTTRRFGGTGLGLAICRELVEAMDGQIGVESRPGHGSTFWCTIPLRHEPTRDQSTAGPHISLNSRRVLVVDDNETSQLILTQLLSNWAMLPTALSSADKALDNLRDAANRGEFYDLAIVDMDMPGIDGLELATRIHARLGIPLLPIILLHSGVPVEAGAVRAVGIVAQLSKPIRQSQLHQCLVKVAAGDHHSDSHLPSTAPRSVLPPQTMGRLLLVEDNEINRLVAEGILAGLGYAIDVAGDGREALSAVADTTYLAVLMDCQMPNMDGYEATRELRRRELRAHELDPDQANPRRRLPIIAMTAAALKEDRDRCLAAGMDDYLTKPIQPDELAAALTRWTAEGRSEKPRVEPDDTSSTEKAIESRLDDLRKIVPEELVSKLVTSFLTRAPGYLLELASALQAEDCDRFANAAHSLRGVAANLGADTVAALCGELENLGRERRLQPAANLLTRLDVAYEGVRRIMQDLS